MNPSQSLKTIILAGGLGTRLSEETVVKPKPMVEICGHPIIWHIKNIYAHYGYGEFIVALGYKERLTAEGQLMAYRHEGYWQPMDKVRKRNLLESLWQTRHAPWKVWP